MEIVAIKQRRKNKEYEKELESNNIGSIFRVREIKKVNLSNEEI